MLLGTRSVSLSIIGPSEIVHPVEAWYDNRGTYFCDIQLLVRPAKGWGFMAVIVIVCSNRYILVLAATQQVRSLFFEPDLLLIVVVEPECIQALNILLGLILDHLILRG